MKKLFIICIFISATAFADVKIGVADFQRALNSVEEGKDAKKKLLKERDKKAKELEGRKKTLEEERKKIEGDVRDGLLSREALTQKGAEFDKKAFELQKLLNEYTQSMQTKEAEYTNTILATLAKIVSEIQEKENYDFILEKSTVIAFKPQYDLTARVIKIFNERKPKDQKATKDTKATDEKKSEDKGEKKEDKK